MSRGVAHRRLGLAAVASAAVAAALCLAAPATAGAAPYVVVGCGTPQGLLTPDHVPLFADGWQPEGLIPPGADTCAEGLVGRGLYAVSEGPFAGYRFDAPHGTALTALWTFFTAHLPAGSALVAQALQGDRWVSVPPARGTEAPPVAVSTWAHGGLGSASALRLGVACPRCSEAPDLAIRTAEVVVEDLEPPRLD